MFVSSWWKTSAVFLGSGRTTVSFGFLAFGCFRFLPSRPVRTATAPLGAVRLRARRTVLLLTPIFAAMARSEEPGSTVTALAARSPAGMYATPQSQAALADAPQDEQIMRS